MDGLEGILGSSTPTVAKINKSAGYSKRKVYLKYVFLRKKRVGCSVGATAMENLENKRQGQSLRKSEVWKKAKSEGATAAAAAAAAAAEGK